MKVEVEIENGMVRFLARGCVYLRGFLGLWDVYLLRVFLLVFWLFSNTISRRVVAVY